MRTKTIAYWTTTGLVALAFIAGGVIDMAGPPTVLETMKHLGYPAYFALLLGSWKLLGGAAILSPRLPRLKEWAYAGMFFDLTGAAISHAASGDGGAKIATPAVLLALTLASWALRPAARKLEGAAPSVQVTRRAEPVRVAA
jgi:uncharacterized membrane protein YphA (DoxX/SURF4 family)